MVMVHVPVDEDDRYVLVPKRAVPTPVALHVGVNAGHEDDPGEVAVQEDPHVLVLVDLAEGLGAEHTGVVVPDQRRASDPSPTD